MILRLVRFQNWWLFKIPPLLSIAYILIIIKNFSFQDSIILLSGIFISIICVAIYGYLINDIFDKEEDKLLGKLNLIGEKSVRFQVGIIVIFVILGFTFPMILNFNPLSKMFLGVNFLLPTLYSVPPFRFKEKGLLGIIFDSLGVHVIPTLFVGSVILSYGNSSSLILMQLIIAILWAFFYGVRGVIIHQIWDRENDIKAQVKTFISNTEINRVIIIISWIFFPLEISLMVFLLFSAFDFLPFLPVLLISYFLIETARYKINSSSIFTSIPSKARSYITPADFYEVWLPIYLVINLSVLNYLFIILLIIHVGLFFNRIQNHVLELGLGMSKFLVNRKGNHH